MRHASPRAPGGTIAAKRKLPYIAAVRDVRRPLLPLDFAMDTGTSSAAETGKLPPSWRPLNSLQRRIVGVLVEKAKTTPDGYPMTINGIVTGCNQKNNRDPQMTVDAEQIEEALEKLRETGSVTELIGSGRVSKFRHHMYEWLGVDPTEIAVMTELLLRGTQSVGDLRGRAARMAKIAGVEELRPILQGLAAKNLIVFLTPEGRGQIVTHNLWSPDELAKQKTKVAQGAFGDPTPERPSAPSPVPSHAPVAAAPSVAHSTSAAPPRPAAPVGPAATSSGGSAEVAALRAEVAELRAEVARLKREVEDIWSSLK